MRGRGAVRWGLHPGGREKDRPIGGINSNRRPRDRARARAFNGRRDARVPALDGTKHGTGRYAVRIGRKDNPGRGDWARTTPAALRALTWPTMPCDTFLASSASSRPRPRMWLCAPMRSMRVRSLISATFTPSPPSAIFSLSLPVQIASGDLTIASSFLVFSKAVVRRFLDLSSCSRYGK